MSDEYCTYGVSHGNWGRRTQCSRKAKKDGFCKQHHPDSIKKRRAEREKASDDKWDAIVTRNWHSKIAPTLNAALERIADGTVEDPARYARQILKEITDENS